MSKHQLFTLHLGTMAIAIAYKRHCYHDVGKSALIHPSHDNAFVEKPGSRASPQIG